MKKKLSMVLILTLIIIVTIVPIAYAGDGDTNPISDEFITGESVDVTKKINGDLYVAGNYINVSSTIDGDLLAAGQVLNISAQVEQNIRAGGSDLIFNNVTARNMTVFGQNITLTNVFANNLYLFGASIKFSGEANDVVIAGGTVIIDGTINGFSEIDAGTVIITEDAVIGGVMNVSSSNAIEYQGNVDKSNINYSQIEDFKYDSEKNSTRSYHYQGRTIGGNIFRFFRLLATIFVTGLVLLFAFPKANEDAVNNLRANTYKPILIGLLLFVGVPGLSIIAMITVIGLPLAFATLLAYAIVIVLAGGLTALAAGELSFPKMNKVLGLLIVSSIMSLLTFIPVINVIVWFVTISYAFGSTTLLFKKNKVVETTVVAVEEIVE